MGILEDYTPWDAIWGVVVHAEDPEGKPVIVKLPYVAARSKEAVKNTAIIVASKAARDHYMHSLQAQKFFQIHNLLSQLYEPPLQRFRCETCENEWDAWIAEDGTLEDKWSCVCTNGWCPDRGSPAVLIRD